MKHFLLIIFLAILATSAFAQTEQTMYWIGGAGSWSDLTHWSYQSGTQDPSNQPSSVPTATTNVIIDGNSGLAGTTTSSARRILINVSPVIKSLTFTPESNAFLHYSGDRILRVTGDITLQANTTITSYRSFNIVMEPDAGNTSTLTTNNNPLTFYFGKNGSGTTNIVGDNISGIDLRVYGGTLNFNGINWSGASMYVMNDGTVMNMSNINTYTNTGVSYVGGTATDYSVQTASAMLPATNAQLIVPQVTSFSSGATYVHSSYGLTLPLCTTFSLGEGSPLNILEPSFLSMPVCTTITGYSFTLSSTIAQSFPALQTLTLTSEMETGNANTSLALGTGGTLVACRGWGFSGTLLNADKSEFHITYTGTAAGTSTNNAHFLAKDGTQINKVIFDNANAEAYLSSTGTYSQGITIGSVTFMERGATIAQSMSIGTLTVAPSAAYTISSGRTITLTNDLVDTTPDCETYWQLRGSSVATLNNSTGHSIVLENVQIFGIIGAGTDAINATGIDDGGNTNITFTAPNPKKLYWVGHAGDDQWHTLENWSRTSGGSDYCTPTQYDDIVFDENSVITGDAITITTVNAYFHDITIEDDCPKTTFSILPSPINSAVAPAIYCYGSWYMKPGVSVYPDVYFMSDDMDETITSNTSTFSDIYFTNVGGWVLEDDLKTVFNTGSSFQYGDLILRNGTLNTNGHKVDIANSFDGNDSGASYLPAGSSAMAYRKLVLGSSEITIRGRLSLSSCNWFFGNTVTDTLDAGTSTIIFDPANSSIAGSSTLSAYSSAISTDISPTALNGALNPSVVARNEALGTLRYYNIVFKGLGTNRISNAGQTSSLTQFEANSIRSEDNSPLTFETRWVKLDSLYAAPFSTVNLPSPTSGTASSIGFTAQLTINESMEIPTPDCTGFSTLKPYNPASATISSAVNINIPNVQMTNVKSTGGGNFTASGIDNGGNDGWIFTERFTKDLYWIGAAGDGLWNTSTNWTSNSDGTPDGGCVPARMDNVHFNQYSVIPADKTIRIETNDANFNNFIAEAGTPSGIIINQFSVQINSYGNLFHTGEDMEFTSNNTSYVVNLLGPATDAQLINGTGSSFYRLVVNNSAAQWTFKDNMTMVNTLTISAVTELTLDMDKLSGYQIVHNAGIVNMADSLMTRATNSFFTYTMNGSCTLNADNTYWNISGFSSTSGTRTLNIRNAQIIIPTTAGSSNYSNWYYSGTGATLNAGGSYIQVYYNFVGVNGHRYGTVETIRGREPVFMNTITGDLYFEKLILNHDRQLVGSNTIDTLLLRPRGLTLYLANGTTQTVNNLMQLSGSPCLQNTLRAGSSTTESGATQISATASINYLNSMGVNEWDQVKVGGILATGDSLKFAGNSSNYSLNNDKVVFYGEPGLVGLPDNTYCAPVDIVANPQAYMLSAKEFYGTDLSTYKWYRQNANGTYSITPLAMPSTTEEIDTRDFGLDGTYKVEIVYDSTATTACKSVDEITITYQAPIITFANGTTTDITWNYCETNTFRVSDLMTKLDSVSEAYTNTVLFDTIQVYDAATGGNLLRDTLTLTNGGDYYLEFVTNNVCTSPMRSHIGVEISDMPTANAGPNQNGNPLNPFTMAATATGGTGEWTLVTGEATIADTASPTTTVQLINDTKQAVLRWTVTNDSCSASDLVTIGKSSIVPRANPAMRVRVQ